MNLPLFFIPCLSSQLRNKTFLCYTWSGILSAKFVCPFKVISLSKFFNLLTHSLSLSLYLCPSLRTVNQKPRNPTKQTHSLSSLTWIQTPILQTDFFKKLFLVSHSLSKTLQSLSLSL